MSFIVSQNCPALRQVIFSGCIYRIRETGETNQITESAASVNEKVQQIVSAVIRPGMDDFEKALVLHNWLTLNAN